MPGHFGVGALRDRQFDHWWRPPSRVLQSPGASGQARRVQVEGPNRRRDQLAPTDHLGAATDFRPDPDPPPVAARQVWWRFGGGPRTEEWRPGPEDPDLGGAERGPAGTKHDLAGARQGPVTANTKAWPLGTHSSWRWRLDPCSPDTAHRMSECELGLSPT